MNCSMNLLNIYSGFLILVKAFSPFLYIVHAKARPGQRGTTIKLSTLIATTTLLGWPLSIKPL